MASNSGSKDPISSRSSKAFASTSSVPPPFPNDSILESFPYDVFLSFRGEDTRNNFIGHLYDRLVMAGIRTFMDDPDLRIGADISQQLMTAIEESKIYIVVFSNNYASSRWCLDELVRIADYSYEKFRVLIPVFYGIDPSDVRRQKGSFEEAFKNHEDQYVDQLKMVARWRDTLTEAANLAGFDLQTSALGSESRLISMIIEEVLSQVKPKKLFVAKYPVGLDSCVKDVCSLLTLEPSNGDIRLLGIWGMGGSGKTVIAKALCNKILPSFDSSCFLSNVRENEQSNGLVYLQEQLISELLMRKNFKIRNVDRGKEMIRERLHCKKVLIVLDDTDKLSQLDALAGHRNWFGPGSVVVITTRDQHLLNLAEVDEVYEAMELSSDESLELFSWHSFKTRFPKTPYAAIAGKIVAYSCGLPLALEVLGAFLFGRTIQQWESAYEKLQQIPLAEIQEILEISYDGLDYQEREIFLDIACFFIGMDIDYVIEILNGCAFKTEIGIGILKDRCLLTVNKNNELRMHDLLRDMGREIVRQRFPGEPGKRSRLWSHKDATDILTRNMGTNAIEGVSLISPVEEEIHLNTLNFARMRNLRLLQMDNVNLNGSFDHLSEKITWIRWQDCSLEHLPYNLKMENLVVLDMQHSKLRSIWQGNLVTIGRLISNKFSWMSRVWQGNQVTLERLVTNKFSWMSRVWQRNQVTIERLITKNFSWISRVWQVNQPQVIIERLITKNFSWMSRVWQVNLQIDQFPAGHLKILDLSHSKHLTSTPDFNRAPSLVKLILEGCTSLIQIDPSIGSLKNLLVLNLKGCEKITNIPFEVCRLRSLGYLNLSGCSNLKELPDCLGYILYLRELYADETVITCVPPSFGNHRSLTSLSLRGCTKMSGKAGALISIVHLYSSTFRLSYPLRRLNLRDCNLSDEDFPFNIGSLSSLQELDLAGNSLSKLPSSFRQLTNLESLWLDDWSILQSIPQLPPNLEALAAKNISAST